MDVVDQILSGITYDSQISEEVARKFGITSTQVKFILCLHTLSVEDDIIVSTSQVRERLNLSEVSFYVNLKPLEEGYFLSVEKTNYRNYFVLDGKGRSVVRYYRTLLRRYLLASG